MDGWKPFTNPLDRGYKITAMHEPQIENHFLIDLEFYCPT